MSKQKNLLNTSEVNIKWIRNEETAMSVVKVLVALGYDLEVDDDNGCFKIWGRRKYIISLTNPETPTIEGLHIASILTELRQKDKVHIQMLSSEGGTSMDIIITKTEMKE